MTMAEIERTCRIIISNVNASMMGNRGNMACVAFADSSIEPACSMR